MLYTVFAGCFSKIPAQEVVGGIPLLGSDANLSPIRKMARLYVGFRAGVYSGSHVSCLMGFAEINAR